MTTLMRSAGASKEPRGVDSRRWLHLCNGLDPRRDGGMVPSILGMTGALARRHGSIRIVTPTESRLDSTALPQGVELEGPETGLEEAVRDADVVHLHGLWQGHTRRGAKAARLAKIPYMIAAHGMAEPWAMRHKALKKKIYTAVVEGKNLRKAACLHALSRPEVHHLRALAPDTPVALVPNGVDLAPFDRLPPKQELESEYPELAGKFALLFFGRVHKKKGLDLLAPAIAAASYAHPNLHLILAGTDDGALAPFLDQAETLGIRSRITAVGHVSGEAARRVWSRADAFTLPSYSEGFSMAILEALACRLPSLVTTACHFPELAATESAVVVTPTVADVTLGLMSLMGMSDGDRAAMGERGRLLVESQYTWDQQAKRLGDVYRWLSGGGPVPEAVEAAGGA